MITWRFTQNSHYLPRGHFVQTRTHVSPLLRSALRRDYNEWSDVTGGKGEQQHFGKLSGHCVGGGHVSRYLHGLCVRGCVIWGEEVLFPVMLPQQAPGQPWKSLSALVPPSSRASSSFVPPSQQSWGRVGMGGVSPPSFDQTCPSPWLPCKQGGCVVEVLGDYWPQGHASFRKHLELLRGRECHGPLTPLRGQGLGNVV